MSTSGSPLLFSYSFRVKSIDEILHPSSSPSDAQQLGHTTSTNSSNRIVVYASLSDEARIRHVSAPYRWYVIFLACVQFLLVTVSQFWELGDTSIREHSNSFDSILLIMGSLSGLVALKRSKPWGFLLVSLTNSTALLFALYHGLMLTTEPWLISSRILSLVVASSQWYLNNMLRELHSPQTFLMKQEN